MFYSKIYKVSFVFHSIIIKRHMYKVFEQKRTNAHVILLFKDDLVYAKYVSRATRSCFFVIYVLPTSGLDKSCMH